MTALPPSPFTDSVAPMPSATDTAAAIPTPLDAAAGQSSMTTGGLEETPAVFANPLAAGVTDHFGCDISDVGEIFHHARLLVAEDNAVHRRFVLDQRAFEEALEEPPLFLQRVG